MKNLTITASEGMIFRRIHDGLEMGSAIILGFDYSTGEKREDKAEYYEEVEKPVGAMSKEDAERLNELLLEEQSLLQ